MKGQVFSVDSLIGFGLFLIVISLIALTWIILSITPEQKIQEKAVDAADFIVTGKIAVNNVLNCSKLNDMMNQDYNDLREEMNVLPHDLLIDFDEMDTDVCENASASYGKNVTSDVEKVSSVTRIFKGVNKIVRVNIKVY